MSQRIRIQNALITLAKAWKKFYDVVYDPETGLATVGTNAIVPATVLANEIAASFALNEQDGRAMTLKKTSWNIELFLAFDQEVLFEEFELQLRKFPPIVTRDTEKNLPQARLMLERVTFSHPPQQQPSSGSQARFIFGVKET